LPPFFVTLLNADGRDGRLGGRDVALVADGLTGRREDEAVLVDAVALAFDGPEGTVREGRVGRLWDDDAVRDATGIDGPGVEDRVGGAELLPPPPGWKGRVRPLNLVAAGPRGAETAAGGSAFTAGGEGASICIASGSDAWGSTGSLIARQSSTSFVIWVNAARREADVSR
jgi:hypothetical protein